MILNAIIGIFLDVLTWLIGLLPSINLPDLSGAISAIGNTVIWQWISWANWYLPVDLAVSLFAVRITLTAGMFVFEGIEWAATKLHILGGD